MGLPCPASQTTNRVPWSEEFLDEWRVRCCPSIGRNRAGDGRRCAAGVSWRSWRHYRDDGRRGELEQPKEEIICRSEPKLAIIRAENCRMLWHTAPLVPPSCSHVRRSALS
jgi:hypothetical protein